MKTLQTLLLIAMSTALLSARSPADDDDMFAGPDVHPPINRDDGKQDAQRPDDKIPPPRMEADQDRRQRDFAGRRRPQFMTDALSDLVAQLELTSRQRAKVGEILQVHRRKREQWHRQHKAELVEIDRQLKKLRQQRRALMAGAPSPLKAMREIRPLLDEQQQNIVDDRVERLQSSRRDVDRQKRRRPKEARTKDKLDL